MSSMNLWGNVSQKRRLEMTRGFRYDPFIVAAIIRKDVDSIEALSKGDHSSQTELSFKQYDFLVRKYGLDALSNPMIFAYLLAYEEMENGNLAG